MSSMTGATTANPKLDTIMSKYNGRTNRETRLVNLWLNNDSGAEPYWQERAVEALADNNGDTSEATYQLAGEIEDEARYWANEAFPESGMLQDLLGSALSAVDWYEVAEGFIEDAEE